METLAFNSRGQWTLLEKRNDRPADNDYLSYKERALEGQLPDPTGTKGSMPHMGTNQPKKLSPSRMKGKVPTPTRSQFSMNNPGLEDIS